MADLEVTLGARNEASEVLKRFQQDFQSTAQNVQFSIRGLAQLAGVTAVVVGLIESAKAVVTFASDSVTAFDDVNRSAIRLGETLDIIPGVAGKSSESLAKMAQELERVTNVDQGQIVNQMTAAARRGADPKQLDEMAEAAIGLARVFDRDLAGGMRLVEQATQGNFDAFASLIPGIQQLATEEEKLAAVSRLAQIGLENKAKAARGALESSDALRVSMKQLYQTVGALLAPIRDVVYKGLVVFNDFLMSQMVPNIGSFEDTLESVRKTAESVAMQIGSSFISGFTMAETAITHFQDVVNVAINSATLQILRLVNDVPFMFRGMVDQVTFLMENMGNITLDIFEGRSTFEEAFSRMPPIGERAITETERALQAAIDSGVGDLFTEFDRRFRERMDSLRRGFQMPFNVNLGPNPRQQQQGGLQGQLRDLQAFESRILTRGPAQSPVDKIAENTAKMVEKQDATVRAIEGIDLSPSTNIKLEEVR